MSWQPMTPGDLPDVNVIMSAVHLLPEDEAVFAERLHLYPAGCFMLKDGTRSVGYIISHPWLFGGPPALNVLLGQLPSPATTYYLHDIALLPSARRSGASSEIVKRLAVHAQQQRFSNLSLVAVYNSAEFWKRQKFEAVDDPNLQATLASYEAAARYMTRRLQ